MPSLEIFNYSGPETAAHEFVDRRQAVLVLKVFGLAGPFLGAINAHDGGSDLLFRRVQRHRRS